MNSEYVNAFLVSAASVLQTACGLTLTPGKPYEIGRASCRERV